MVTMDDNNITIWNGAVPDFRNMACFLKRMLFDKAVVFIVIIYSSLLCGCSYSEGIKPIGEDIYQITEGTAMIKGGGHRSREVAQDAAAKFCMNYGKRYVKVSEKAFCYEIHPGMEVSCKSESFIGGDQYISNSPGYTLNFRCVNDRQLPVQAQNPWQPSVIPSFILPQMCLRTPCDPA